MIHKRVKDQGQRPLDSDVRVETNGRTDGRTGPTAVRRRLKCEKWKMREKKMRHKIALVENVGKENAGKNLTLTEVNTFRQSAYRVTIRPTAQRHYSTCADSQLPCCVLFICVFVVCFTCFYSTHLSFTLCRFNLITHATFPAFSTPEFLCRIFFFSHFQSPPIIVL